MRTILYKHNKTAYQKVMKAFETADRTCVVHPTGTGKSYLIAAVSESFKKVLILGPNTFVLDQVHDVLKWRKRGVEYMTYSLLMLKEKLPTGYDLICLDEFHRAGAQGWGAAVNRLLDANKDAKAFGTTATPIRYLDNERNMSDELFNGNVASYITIGEAWTRSILPVPTYVIGLFDFHRTLDDAERRINESDKIDAKEKRRRLVRLSNMRLEWEQSYGMPTVLQRHIDKDTRRVLVFCADIERLEVMRETVTGWFRMAGFKIASVSTMHKRMGLRQLRDEMNLFESDEGVGVRLMFSVNMLNEGVHIPRVGVVLMLRTTSSRIIHLQQMGRCLTAANTEKPVVLDMVDNLTTTTAIHDVYGDYDSFTEGMYDEISGNDTRRFSITDYRQTMREVLEKISPMELARYSVDERIDMVEDFTFVNGRVPNKKDGVIFIHYRNMVEMHRDHPRVQAFLEKHPIVNPYVPFEERYNRLKAFCERMGRFPCIEEREEFKNWRAVVRGHRKGPHVVELFVKYGKQLSDLTVLKARLKLFVAQNGAMPKMSRIRTKEEYKLGKAFFQNKEVLMQDPEIRELEEKYGFRGKVPPRIDVDAYIDDVEKYADEHGELPSLHLKYEGCTDVDRKWKTLNAFHRDHPRVIALKERFKAKKYTQQQRNVRSDARKLGYRLGKVIKCQLSDRYSIYYTSETKRNMRLEAYAKENGIYVKKEDSDYGRNQD